MGVTQAIAWLWTTGGVLVAVGLLGWMLAVAGHRVGGRRIWR